MKHLDLFSGIGGFAYAVDQVWPQAEHTFVEIDSFCQEVLSKHWPNARITGDIRQLQVSRADNYHLLTGGFPCQPFSVAGQQRGKKDDRYLWPEMLRVIKEAKPTWVIGENVAGIINLALEQVCLDLETEGYEVWPLVIPACAVNAPHRRDRVWILGHSQHIGLNVSEERQSNISRNEGIKTRETETSQPQRPDLSWDKDWLEVATELCRMDDGVSKRLDRNNRLKALGNSIVPQVAIEIMLFINLVDKSN